MRLLSAHQFHFQETLFNNPAPSEGIRHYETIYLDRRPKPEAYELMKLMRRYVRKDQPLSELPVRLSQIVLKDGKGRADFTIENKTGRKVTATLIPECFDGAKCRLDSPKTVTIAPAKTAKGALEIALRPEAQHGVYHYFLRVEYSGKTSYGWGFAENRGAPAFKLETAIPEFVEYPQGPSIVEKIDWSRPLCIAFGADSPVQEMEMAYYLHNTLQSATGVPILLCSTNDIPKDMLEKGNLILAGSAKSNPLVAKVSPQVNPGRGTVILHDAGNGRQWLLLTGDGPRPVEAAEAEIILRYWQTAKDSSIPIAGMEKGAAFGNRDAVGRVWVP
jgi:hypothetical protein